jgi:hypothetical protein
VRSSASVFLASMPACSSELLLTEAVSAIPTYPARRRQDLSEPTSTSASMVGSFEEFMRSQSQGAAGEHRSFAASDDAAAGSHAHEEELPRVRPRRAAAARSSRLSPEPLPVERPTAAPAGRPPRAVTRPGFRSSYEEQVIPSHGSPMFMLPLTDLPLVSRRLSSPMRRATRQLSPRSRPLSQHHRLWPWMRPAAGSRRVYGPRHCGMHRDSASASDPSASGSIASASGTFSASTPNSTFSAIPRLPCLPEPI